MINLLTDKASRALSILLADPNDQTLYARFAKETGNHDVFTYHLGDHYDYIVQRLLEAKSLGREFNIGVRGQYDGEMIQDPSMLEAMESFV